MRFIPSFAVFLLFSSLTQYAAAVDTPDDTYFQCDNFLIAMETSWKQRMENKFEDYYATVRTGYEELKPGQTAIKPLPDVKGRAYPDRIELRTGVTSKIDRRTGVLERHVRLDLSGEELLSGNYKTKEWQSHPCKIITKAELHEIIDQYNKSFGNLKF